MKSLHWTVICRYFFDNLYLFMRTDFIHVDIEQSSDVEEGAGRILPLRKARWSWILSGSVFGLISKIIQSTSVIVPLCKADVCTVC